MTTGFLWTGQFEELTKVIQEGQPHSMELDGESIDGHWATDNNLGIEFFIINDATFSKLCILGDDVEPCYEGSSVTSLEVDSKFTKNDNFEHTLFTMMQELKDTLNSEGGLNMSKEFDTKDDEVIENTEPETVENTEPEVFSEEPQNENDATSEENSSDEEFKEDDKANSDDKDDEDAKSDSKEDDKKVKNQHSLEEFELLQKEIESLRAENQELRNFKLDIEIKQKQALIDKYFMLSEEDKADIVKNMENYSLDEIEAKLAILYVKENVNFDKVDGQSENQPSPALSFSLEEDVNDETLSELQRALRETVK